MDGAVPEPRPFELIPVRRVVMLALRTYARNWRAYTFCFLVFAAPVVLLDLLLGETYNVPDFIAQKGATIPGPLSGMLQKLSHFTPLSHLVTIYFLASLAATVVLTALSEFYHDRPIHTSRCVIASWGRLRSMLAISFIQAVAIVLVMGVAFTLLFVIFWLLPDQTTESMLLVLGGTVLVMLFCWLLLVLICILVAVSVAQIVLQRARALPSVGRAARIVCARARWRTIAKQGVILSVFSMLVLALAATVVFWPIGHAPPAFAKAAYAIGVIVLPALFWPPITIVYTLYAIQLLAYAERATNAAGTTV